MPTIEPPPIRVDILTDEIKTPGPVWARWFFDMFTEAKTVQDRNIISYNEVTITANTLDGGGTPIVFKAESTTAQYKVREIILSANGTNFGSGGDRTLIIEDQSATRKYTIIPNATLESLVAGRWGDTAVAYPTTAEDLLAPTTAGENIVARYDGGSVNHGFVGSLTILIVLEKVTL